MTRLNNPNDPRTRRAFLPLTLHVAKGNADAASLRSLYQKAAVEADLRKGSHFKEMAQNILGQTVLLFAMGETMRGQARPTLDENSRLQTAKSLGELETVKSRAESLGMQVTIWPNLWKKDYVHFLTARREHEEGLFKRLAEETLSLDDLAAYHYESGSMLFQITDTDGHYDGNWKQYWRDQHELTMSSSLT